MKKKILDLLNYMQECKEMNSYPTDTSFKNEGFDKSDLNEANAWSLIKWNGANWYITTEGYNLLIKNENLNAIKDLKKSIIDFKNSTSKVNKEMLNHTKAMKYLTIAILILTIVNIIIVIIK